MEASLLEILCCPVTHQPLLPADRALLDNVNAQIATGTMKTTGGKILTAPLQDALLREDGRMLYPICDGIPALLPAEGIPL